MGGGEIIMIEKMRKNVPNGREIVTKRLGAVLNWLIVALFFSFPFSGLDVFLRPIHGEIFQFTLKLTNIFVVLGGAVAVIKLLVAGKIPRIRGPHWVLAAFALAALTGYFTAVDRQLFFAFYFGLLRGLAIIFLFWAADQPSPVFRRTLFWAAAACLLGAAIAVWQEIMVLVIYHAPYLGNITPPPWLTRAWILLEGYPIIRASAFTLEPNYFSLIPATAFILLGSGAVAIKKGRAWLMALALSGVFLTFSRGAAVGLSVVAVAQFVPWFLARKRSDKTSRPSKAPLFWIAATILVVILMIAARGRDRSIEMRTESAAGAVTTVTANATLGVGLGNDIRYDWRGGSVHNFPLEILLSTGVVGLLIWLVFAYLVIQQIRWAWRRDPAFGAAYLQIAVFVGTLSLTLNMLTHPVFWALVGLMMAGAREEVKK